MNIDVINFANFVASELRAQMIPNVQLYRTGNMFRSVMVVSVDDQFIDVVIATSYASDTNEKGRNAGWIERVVDRCSRCYSSNNQVDPNSLIEKMTVMYGG